jgi:hypothetical protein
MCLAESPTSDETTRYTSLDFCSLDSCQRGSTPTRFIASITDNLQVDFACIYWYAGAATTLYNPAVFAEDQQR